MLKYPQNYAGFPPDNVLNCFRRFNMKKVFAIAVAMVLALFVIPSHADGKLCVDGAYLTNDADGSAHAQGW